MSKLSSYFGLDTQKKSIKLNPRNKSKSTVKNIFLNSIIFILTVFIGVFIYSFSNKQLHNGKPFEITFPPTTDPPPLSTVYQEDPLSKFPIEVLNGCGVKGMAGSFSEFFRENKIDVLISDDANHYNYTNTLVISRTGNIQILSKVVSLLGFDIKDKNHILNVPDSDSNVDLTVIIGSDYSSIKPVMDFLEIQY